MDTTKAGRGEQLVSERARAHPTMGIILLGGISDRANRLPRHTTAGIAYTGINDDIYAETLVYAKRGAREGMLNGRRLEVRPGERSPFGFLDKCSEPIFTRAGLDSKTYSLSFESNNYGILSGSSDAGAAAIGLCAVKLCGGNLDMTQFENELRSISESVGRSLYGGLTITPKIGGQPPRTEKLLSEGEFAGYLIVACHFESARRVSADAIHESIVKHPEYERRVRNTDERGHHLRELAGEKDVEGIFELAKADADEWHGFLRGVGVNIITPEMHAYMGWLNEQKSFWNSYLVVSGTNVFTFVRGENVGKVAAQAPKYDAKPVLLKVASGAESVYKAPRVDDRLPNANLFKDPGRGSTAMSVESSGVAKLSGEHFVLHGARSLTVTLEKSVRVEARDVKKAQIKGEHFVVHGALPLAAALPSEKLKISLRDYSNLRDYSKPQQISRKRLRILLSDFKNMIEKVNALDKINAAAEAEKKRVQTQKLKFFEAFVRNNSDIKEKILPFAVVAARLEQEGVRMAGHSFEFHSDIPPQAGLASSASCYTAFAALGYLLEGKTPDRAKLIDIGREGERLNHGSTSAGGMDVSACVVGGYVSFDKNSGATSEEIQTKLRLVVIYTGDKPSTRVAVGVTENFRIEHSERTKLFDKRMTDYTNAMIEILKDEKLSEDEKARKVGRIMRSEQRIFKEMGVSSECIDEAGEIMKGKTARKYHPYGYKITGGGMGGAIIALAKDPEGLAEFMTSRGFPSFATDVTTTGVLRYFGKTQTNGNDGD